MWLPPTGDLAHNPGIRPDWKSNQQPFGLQAATQSTEPHQPGTTGNILRETPTVYHTHTFTLMRSPLQFLFPFRLICCENFSTLLYNASRRRDIDPKAVKIHALLSEYLILSEYANILKVYQI